MNTTGKIVCDNCGSTNEVIFYDTHINSRNGVIPDGFEISFGECWCCKTPFEENRRKKYVE